MINKPNLFLICQIALYELHQPIILKDINNPDDEKIVSISSLDTIAEDIAAAAAKYGVEQIHLFGNGDFLVEVINDINKYSISKFNKNNLTIEVN